MLIVPETDPPDAAFQRNTAPVLVQAVVHHVPPGTQHPSAFKAQIEQSESSDRFCQRHSNGSDLIVPFVSHQILRC
jgi:hypothetical protein